MTSVTADQVRKRLGLTPTDIKDEDVMAFIAEAAAWRPSPQQALRRF